MAALVGPHQYLRFTGLSIYNGWDYVESFFSFLGFKCNHDTLRQNWASVHQHHIKWRIGRQERWKGSSVPQYPSRAGEGAVWHNLRSNFSSPTASWVNHLNWLPLTGVEQSVSLTLSSIITLVEAGNLQFFAADTKSPSLEQRHPRLWCVHALLSPRLFWPLFGGGQQSTASCPPWCPALCAAANQQNRTFSIALIEAGSFYISSLGQSSFGSKQLTILQLFNVVLQLLSVLLWVNFKSKLTSPEKL